MNGDRIGKGQGPTAPSASAWPEADRLFRSDPRWLGSDDAYSIPLAEDRTLWLFGDTFIAEHGGAARPEASFVRNSIGVQGGNDPSRASIDLHWQREGPSSFFRTDQPGYPVWLWPLHGALIEGRLLLFFMKVRPPGLRSAGPIEDWRKLGSVGFFDVYDWEAIVVSNPLDPPPAWKMEPLLARDPFAGIVLGATALVGDEFLYAFGWREREREGFLARWPLESPASGDLRGGEWWSGASWVGRTEDAACVLPEATTEFTVHYEDRFGLWCLTQVTGAAPQTLALRWAEKLEGPWSKPAPVFVPEEAARPEVMIYAGKAHPQMSGADLVLTYASNGREVDVTLRDESIYYPRFVRLTF